MPKPTRVLMVAGVAGGAELLRPLARTLVDAGAIVTIAPAPLVCLGPVAHDAARVRDLVLRLPEGQRLFGYSRGGLVGALALEHPRVAARIPRFVTYSAPFDGVTPFWPDWHTLKRAARVLADPGRHWSLTAVHGSRDRIVPVPRRNVPPEDQLLVPFGHLDFFRDDGLQRLLTKVILEGA